MKEAILLEGKKIAEKLLTEIEAEVKQLMAPSIEGTDYLRPTIVAVSVGNNKASEVYLKSQKKIADKVGINHIIKNLNENISEEELIKIIKVLNKDTSVHGIIVPIPLPKHIKISNVLDSISKEKDVEGVHPYNLGRLVLKKNIFVPCTAQAVMELIDSSGINLYGAEVVIVGAGKVVGRPLSLLLMEKMATTTICNIATFEKKHLLEHVGRAEVLIVAVGKAGVIKGDWIKEGSIVIDVGINRVGDKIVGDVEFEVARKRASYITQVPGGVGPMTVAILMKNVLTAFKRQKDL